jgi:hypothetical protein
VLKCSILFDILVVLKHVFSLFVIYLCFDIVSYKLICQSLIFFMCRPMAVEEEDDLCDGVPFEATVDASAAITRW